MPLINRYVNVCFLLTSVHMDMFGYVLVFIIIIIIIIIIKLFVNFLQCLRQLYSLFKCEKIN